MLRKIKQSFQFVSVFALVSVGVNLFTFSCNAQENCSCLFGKKIGGEPVSYTFPAKCESQAQAVNEKTCSDICVNKSTTEAPFMKYFFGSNHKTDCENSLKESNSKCMCSCLYMVDPINEPAGMCQFRGNIRDNQQQCAESCIPRGGAYPLITSFCETMGDGNLTKCETDRINFKNKCQKFQDECVKADEECKKDPSKCEGSKKICEEAAKKCEDALK